MENISKHISWHEGTYSRTGERRDLEEKARGLAAKDRLKVILEGANRIELCSYGVGKYGRCLGELHVDMLDGKQCLTLANVNELLIKEGHAVAYDGGKR